MKRHNTWSWEPVLDGTALTFKTTLSGDEMRALADEMTKALMLSQGYVAEPVEARQVEAGYTILFGGSLYVVTENRSLYKDATSLELEHVNGIGELSVTLDDHQVIQVWAPIE